jgi:hypothetical protein
MKKIILAVCLMTAPLTQAFADPVDEAHMQLEHKAIWAAQEGEKFAKLAQEQEDVALKQAYLTQAMEFFKLEKSYMTDRNIWSLINMIKMMEMGGSSNFDYSTFDENDFMPQYDATAKKAARPSTLLNKLIS